MAISNRLILISVAIICLVHFAESHGRKGSHNKGGFFGLRLFNSFDNDQRRLEKSIQQNITDAIADKISTEVYIQIFTALNSTEAQQSLKQLKIEPVAVNTLLKKLKGTAQEVAEARQTIKTQAAAVRLDQLKKKDWKAIKQILSVFQNYQCKLQAKKAISADSTDKLIKGLTALAGIERIFWFRGILFADLVEILKKNGEQGRNEVIDKLNKWIDSADIQSVKKASLVYTLATASSATTPPPTGQSTTPQWSSLSTTTSPGGQPAISTTPSGGQSPSTTIYKGPE